MSDQFTVNWWEHLFNSAASKIKENDATDAPKQPKQQQVEKKEEKETNNSNPLNKKSFYYSRFTKVKNFIF